MGLSRVWIQTLDSGLVRADHVIEVLAHKTAPFAGKPAHWLLDVATATNQGAGTSQQWNLGAAHRTLIQTDTRPHGAVQRLAALLAAIDTADPAGIVTARHTADDATVDFTFELFAPPHGLEPSSAPEPRDAPQYL
jgi:hypothetical protein